MTDKHEDRFEQRLRHVAKHYREGAMDENKAWEQFAGRQELKRKVTLYRFRYVAAAAILVLLAITTRYYMTIEKENWLVVSTDSGQKKNVFLPDSSFVAMAENSTIRYDLNGFRKGRRDVEMKGKIFFQVKKKESSPFSVTTTRTVVTVLGTSFQLGERDNDTELYVASGKVAFAAKGAEEKTLLTAGMSARHKAGSDVPEIREESNENALSWRTKELRFVNTPLDLVIRDLSGYYGVTVMNRIKDENKSLTASFNDLPLEETLLIINQTLDVHLVVVK